MRTGKKLVDCHAHLSSAANINHLEALRRHTGAVRMSIVCSYHPKNVNGNPAAFAAKSVYPGRFYVFAGFDHSEHFSGGSVHAPSLAEQVDELRRIGADGVKLLETKPDGRKELGIPIDSDYFEGFFARAEETETPILWHAADPPEFWDPNLTPAWAVKRGWNYDHTFVSWETLQQEVENVLQRHPRLRVIFAHFLFLSHCLDRADGLLRRYDGVHLDLAPGIELLYNLSRNVERSREFFEQHSDRIVFGTDIWDGLTFDQATHRSAIVQRFLETEDEFRVPVEADYLLGPPEDGVIRGLSLSEDALDRIYYANFERLAGPAPRALNSELALQECARIAAEARSLGGNDEADNAARLIGSTN